MSLTPKTSGFLRLTAPALAGLAALAVGLLNDPSAAQAAEKTKCLWTNQIDHTQILNDHQILFYETNGKIWQSNLPTPCRSMSTSDGVAFNSTSQARLCGNLEQFNVIRSGESCLLGPFVSYVPGNAQGENTAPPTDSRTIRPR